MGPRARTLKRRRWRPRPDERPHFIRFVCFQLVDGMRCRLGLFQALEDAQRSEQAPDWALAELGAADAWFTANLPAPSRLGRGTWKGRGQPALSWFKSAAEDHIGQMFEVKAALEACGIHVEVLRTRDPGVILYEDEWQIAAEPGHRRF